MYIMVDIETDGPSPALNSMIAIGAVIVDRKLDRTFYGQLCPINVGYDLEALKVCGFTREQTLRFDDPEIVMHNFSKWIKKNTTDRDRPYFISDNNGFDWQFINYYFHKFCCGQNPFGYSSTNLGSLYKGLVRDTFKNFKHLRKTKHTHNPVDDAMGNAEALLYMKDHMGLNIKL